MTSTFLKATVAAALGAWSMTVAAAPVLLDFEALGQQALLGERNPIAVRNIAGFNISGAFAYHTAMLNDRDNAPFPSRTGGFLINRSRLADTASIVVSLDELVEPAARGVAAAAALPAPNVFPGQYFKEVSVLMYTLADRPLLVAMNDDGSKSVTIELSPSDGTKFWSSNGPYLFEADDMLTRLEFRSAGAVLGIDDLLITLTDPGNGGNGGNNGVPEPASYALVGLALLAAGSAKRRKA